MALQAPYQARYIGAATLLVLAVAGIAYFDFGPLVPFNDEYLYSWSVQHLGMGPIYPRQTALALPQMVIGWIISAPFGHDLRALRVSQLVAILPGAWAAYRLARRLGAGLFWGLLSPTVILTSPIFFNLSVSFMSDAVYVSLLLLACNSGASWLEKDSSRAMFAVWATLATLQRVLGVGLVAAFAVTLVLRSRRRSQPLTSSDMGWMAAATVGSIAAAVGPSLLGMSAGQNVSQLLTHFQPDSILVPLIHLPLVLGFLVLPLVGAVRLQWNFRLGLVAFPSAVIVGVILWKFPWLPGNIWTFVGPAPTLGGAKPMPVPFALDLVLIALCPVVFWLLAPAASQVWSRAAKSDARIVFVLVVSAVQLVLLMPNTVSFYDRYYLPVVAPLIPLLCAMAETHARPAAAVFACAACAALLGLSFAYEQDYQSWQYARNQAAMLAYRCSAPSRVNAGYEANAVYVEVPDYERTGRALPARIFGRDPTLLGPVTPDLWLEFAGPADPRRGVTYNSVAPGKIVIDGAVCSAIP